MTQTYRRVQVLALSSVSRVSHIHVHAMCVCMFFTLGQVYLLEGWNTENAAQKGGNKGHSDRRRNIGSVRKTSSAELGGVRLNSNMMTDHSMSAYESAIVAAAQRYRKR